MVAGDRAVSSSEKDEIEDTLEEDTCCVHRKRSTIIYFFY